MWRLPYRNSGDSRRLGICTQLVQRPFVGSSIGGQDWNPYSNWSQKISRDSQRNLNQDNDCTWFQPCIYLSLCTHYMCQFPQNVLVREPVLFLLLLFRSIRERHIDTAILWEVSTKVFFQQMSKSFYRTFGEPSLNMNATRSAGASSDMIILFNTEEAEIRNQNHKYVGI